MGPDWSNRGLEVDIHMGPPAKTNPNPTLTLALTLLGAWSASNGVRAGASVSGPARGLDDVLQAAGMGPRVGLRVIGPSNGSIFTWI